MATEKPAFPVFVFLHAAPIEKGSFAITFPCDGPPPNAWIPVGILPYESIDPSSIKMLEHDLEVQVYPGIISLRDKPGYAGALVGFGIFVETYDEAKAIPGFAPLWIDSGYNFLPPKTLSRTDDPISRHRFEGDGLPKYRDGVFACSCIPQGYIATTIYFEDDPLHFYFAQGSATLGSGDETINAVREWRVANGF